HHPLRPRHHHPIVPARPFATDTQPPPPKAIQAQLPPQLHDQPARPPLPWPAQSQFLQPHSHHRLILFDHRVTAICSKQRKQARLRFSLFEHLNRFTPSRFLR